MKSEILAVIGRGFGDCGKGFCVDWLCSTRENPLVVKHNGGAQAGHTVELEDGKRFVFHQLGSGSFRGASTFWAETYYPDLYKLSDEIEEFVSLSGSVPCIYADPACSVVIIPDVLVNHAIESLRGENRHGSCGMGINEADLRTKAGFSLSLGEIKSISVSELFDRLKDIRDRYFPGRLQELEISKLPEEIGEVFYSDAVLQNLAEIMHINAGFVKLLPAAEIFPKYESIIFETGQGLLLDADCERYAPHVTASRTGLTNPVQILKKCDLTLSGAYYVARSYVTRHGAGPLPYESDRESLGITALDSTNKPNPWQGSLRYAPYESLRDLLQPIIDDLVANEAKALPATLVITHLDETDNCIKCVQGDVEWDEGTTVWSKRGLHTWKMNFSNI